MGSVKDLHVIQKPKVNKPGLGRFIFSDRYSVFDWGEMPDHITDKGAALCIITAHFFEKLGSEVGIASHYLGLVENDQPRKLDDLRHPSQILQCKLVRVVRPILRDGIYDYSPVKAEQSNYLIPLEVIFRNSLPAGSSVFKRLKNGSLKLEDLGFRSIPEPGTRLEKPLLDVSTKLESIDRYISWNEALQISGLTENELSTLQRYTMEINDFITRETERLGLYHEDGKVEFAFDENRNIILVDALGTPDECRFTYEGIPVSKEVARIFYRKTRWYQEVEEAKAKDPVNWKSLVKSTPEKLPAEFAEAISNIYRSFANELTGRNWFSAPPLNEVLKTIKKYIS